MQTPTSPSPLIRDSKARRAGPSAALAVVCLLAGVACSSTGSATTAGSLTTPTTSLSTTRTVPANEDGCVSAEEYAALNTGMSLFNARIILGDDGEELAESSVAGYHTVMYQWEGCGGVGANMNAMFQGGSLVQKAQFGLASNGRPPVMPTTTTTSPAEAAAAEAARRKEEADAEAARRKEEADAAMGGCSFDLIEGHPYTSYETRRDCREVFKGQFKPNMTSAQIDALNVARTEKIVFGG